MSTIITRSGKGSPLTHNEVDANFTNLNGDKYEAGDSPSFGSVTVTGTVDGRDIAADGSKLDGIEAGADVTDTANVTAAGALMDSELTDEAAVKALDQGVATTDSPSFAGLTVDTSTFYVDSTNNRIGIGTSSPATALDVAGTVTATDYAGDGSGLTGVASDTTQAEATWEAGTGTTESIVSPAKIKAAIEALASGGGVTLLGTLTTTSGTSQALSGLTLTDYKFITVSADGVSHSSGFPRSLRIEAQQFSPALNGASLFSGKVDIDLATGIGFGAFFSAGSENVYVQDTGLSTASTSITLTWSSGAAFDAGTVKIYGVK